MVLPPQGGGYVPDLFSVVGGIVSATLAVTQHFLKQQSEHLASLALVNRVLRAIALARKEQVENKRQFIR